ncbi:MAG: hypothetical protein WCA21_05105 [Terracidiphilus sp.]
MAETSTRAGIVWQAFEDAQFARHALGDAHRDEFLVAEGEHYKAHPKVFCSAELNFIPRNAKRGMAEAKEKQHEQIKGIFGSGDADDIVVFHAEAHPHTQQSKPEAFGFAVRFGLLLEAPG